MGYFLGKKHVDILFIRSTQVIRHDKTNVVLIYVYFPVFYTPYTHFTRI